MQAPTKPAPSIPRPISSAVLSLLLEEESTTAVEVEVVAGATVVDAATVGIGARVVEGGGPDVVVGPEVVVRTEGLVGRRLREKASSAEQPK